MPAESAAHVAAALGLGLALAGAPGPVQAVVLSEAMQGGSRRGLQAVAGASLVFFGLLLVVALGVSTIALSGDGLRLVQLAGGLFLLWLAWDGWHAVLRPGTCRTTVPAALRGSLAILLNPGAWLFLGAVASPLFLQAGELGGTPLALATAVALAGGAAAGDVALAVVGGGGLRRAGSTVVIVVRRALALVLAGLGLLLIAAGLLG